MRVQRFALFALAAIAGVGGACAQPRSRSEAGDAPAATAGPASALAAGGDCRRSPGGPKLTPSAGSRQGGTVALAELDGRKVALVADEDARAVVVFDAERRLELASTPVGGVPAQLLVAMDGRVLVALRDQAKIAVLEPSADAPGRLAPRCAVDTPAEPLALAATPDDATVLVTSGWGHALTAFEGATLKKRFAIDLPREPRAVVTSADGERAFVTHAVGARLSAVDLADDPHEVTALGLEPKAAVTGQAVNGKNTLTSCQGYALARVASPGARILAPMVIVNPGEQQVRTAGYGDVSSPTEQAGVAVVDEGEASSASLVMAARDGQPECLLPRAAAVDDESRTLLVACYGIDSVVAYDALAPAPAGAVLRRYRVGGGPSGIAIEASTGRAWVWSQFDRTLSVLAVRDVDPVAELRGGGNPPAERVSLPSVYASAAEHRWAIGRQLFHAVGDARISGDGRACASCHPDGRDDALTWATPDGPRRTAMLAGRLQGSAPFGWTGGSADVREHVGHTFERLRGTGLSSLELEALLTYVGSLEPPRAAPAADEKVARGSILFHSEEAGCARCHRDATAFTDGQRHNVASRADADRASQFDTPSLLFVGARAPYFHDGRYETLAKLLRATSSTMGNTERLSETDFEALEAYLRSL